MRIFNINRGVRGSRTLQENALRFAYMITEEAKRRARILTFWKAYGSKATKEAFGISRTTLFRWQAVLKKKKGKLEALNVGNRAPRHRRKRVIPEVVQATIVRERYFDPQLGKDKLAHVIQEDVGIELSPSTVGRMLTDLKQQGVL